MLKAAKLTLAALFVAGSCGLAVAQTSGSGTGGGADSGGVSTDKPANKDTIGTSKQQSQQMQNKGSAPAMQQKNTGMPTSPDSKTGPTNPANAGPDEAGTAKDTAGTGTQRNPASQKQ
jgi:hypothetical protein